jgi:hypothetical protein
MSVEANEQGASGRTRPPRKGKWRRPPRHGGFSVRNSHTSPKLIALRKKQSTCLTLRAQGYNYAQIAEHMKRPVNTIYRWVSESMDRLVKEPAEQVLRLELARLDDMQSAIFQDAHNGDLSAIAMVLRLQDQRCRLLGLYPKDGTPSVLLNVGAEGEATEKTIAVSFILPSKQPEAPIDLTPSDPVDYRQPRLEPPPERRRGPIGWLEEKPADKGDWMR